VASSGRGTVYSWVVAVHPVAEALVDQVPYVVGLIDLPEGVRVVGNVEGCDPSEVEAGMEVELHFAEVDGTRLPNFRKVQPNHANTLTEREEERPWRISARPPR
jgi:uncharacterized OB-fold protein